MEQENKQLERVPPGHLYTSSLRRTHDTAGLLFPQAPFTESALFDEVPMSTFTRMNILLPALFWLAVVRILWAFNSRRQPETRTQTLARAQRAADLLENTGTDATVISHGLFMRVLVRELRHRGFTLRTWPRYRNLSAVWLCKA